MNDAVAHHPRNTEVQPTAAGSVMGNVRRKLPVSLADAGIPIAVDENNVTGHMRRQLLGSLLGGSPADAAAVAPPPTKSKSPQPDTSKYDTITDDLAGEKDDKPPPKKAATQMGPPPPAAPGGQATQAHARPPDAKTSTAKRSPKKVSNGRYKKRSPTN